MFLQKWNYTQKKNNFFAKKLAGTKKAPKKNRA